MMQAPDKNSDEYKAARLKFSIKPPSRRRELRRQAELIVRNFPGQADNGGFWEGLSARQVYRLQ